MTSNSETKSQREPRIFERLPGEQDTISIKFLDIGSCPCLINPIVEAPIAVSFFLTTFRVVVLPEPKYVPEIILPLAMLESWHWGKEGNWYTLELNSKHVWSFKLGFRTEREASSAKMALDSLQATSLATLPAWDIGAAFLKDADDAASGTNYGWNLYDEYEELERQLVKVPGSEKRLATDEDVGIGKDLRPWYRITDLSCPDNSFGKSPTYPFRFACPTSCSDEFLTECLLARSRGRIPALSWVHLGSGACLARASQPLINKAKKLREDAQLCHYLVNSYTPLSAAPRDQPACPSSPPSSRQVFQDPTPSDAPTTPSPEEKAQSAAAATSAKPPGWMPPPSLADDDDDDDSPRSPVRTSSTAPPLGDSFQTNSPRGRTQSAAPSTGSAGNQPPSVSSTIKTKPLLVHDLRPYAAAFGNLQTGGGYEKGKEYDQCKVSFAGIDNIHGVSASWKKLKELVVSHMGKNYKTDFFKEWQETKWMDHIQKMLIAGNAIVDFLEKGESVLAHCTDGWDRTSQCTSLAMMMLDPHFRTIHGFLILIEKEWCGFGHKFAERCNHLLPGTTFCVADDAIKSDVDPNPKVQISPIFLQWLDAVFQVVRQFPTYFEFTPKLLEYLGQQLYSCYWGTFLTNTPKERWFEGVRLKTVSLWTEVENIVRQEREGFIPINFINPSYDAVSAARFIKKQHNCGIQKIVPSISSKRLVFWEEVYLRHDPDCFKIQIGKPTVVQAELPCGGSEAVVVDSPAEENQVLSTPRYEVPSHVRSNPVTVLHDELVKRAKERRIKEVVFMTDLLTRLHVPSRPAIMAAQGKEASSTTEQRKPEKNAKECRGCREKFGWFNSGSHCSHCMQTFCTKCLKSGPPTYKKMCESCYHMSLGEGDLSHQQQ